MQKETQKIDFFKQNLEKYIKIVREVNNGYSFRISNGLRAGNQNTVFFLSDNFIIFKYFTDPTTSTRLEAFAYGLSGKNKKSISKCIPDSRNIATQTIGIEIQNQGKAMTTRYKIVVSEPAGSNCTSIQSISNKFHYLFNVLNGTK